MGAGGEQSHTTDSRHTTGSCPPQPCSSPQWVPAARQEPTNIKIAAHTDEIRGNVSLDPPMVHLRDMECSRGPLPPTRRGDQQLQLRGLDAQQHSKRGRGWIGAGKPSKSAVGEGEGRGGAFPQGPSFQRPPTHSRATPGPPRRDLDDGPAIAEASTSPMDRRVGGAKD